MPNPEIAPALVERMVALVRQYAANELNKSMKRGDGVYRSPAAEACAIVADLPAPVDPDYELAERVASDWRDTFVYHGRVVMLEHLAAVDLALAAIKRVRQQENPIACWTESGGVWTAHRTKDVKFKDCGDA